MVGEYIGSVFLGPLLLPVLVSGILCAFTKKTRNFASFTRGCCWVLGVLLLSNIGNMFVCSPRGNIHFRMLQFP